MIKKGDFKSECDFVGYGFRILGSVNRWMGGNRGLRFIEDNGDRCHVLILHVFGWLALSHKL